MEAKLERQVLMAEYQAYQDILHQRGISPPSFDTKTLGAMDNSDLRTVVRELRDLARTPITR